MNYYYNKPSRSNITLNVIAWIIIIFLALLVSCKARKVDNNISKVTDKSESSSHVAKKDSSNTLEKTGSKETDKSTEDSKFTNTIIIEYFEPSATIPAGSPKKKTETQTGSSKKESSKSKEVESFLNHSEISSSDSIVSNKSNISKIEKVKRIETKSNTIAFWVGAGLFLIIVGIGIYIWWRFKKVTERH